ALAGEAVAPRFIVDRLTPRPRGRAIALELPTGSGAADIVAAFDATLRAMASGEITPDEALTVTRVLDGKVKAQKAWQREKVSRARQKEPSPACGRGQGEGWRLASGGVGESSPRSPHPNPLPQAGEASEGIVPSAQAVGDFRADLLHSTCISTLPGFMPGPRPGDRMAAFS